MLIRGYWRLRGGLGESPDHSPLKPRQPVSMPSPGVPEIDKTTQTEDVRIFKSILTIG